MLSQNWVQDANGVESQGRWKKMKDEFRRFCICTTIHGFKYVADRTLHPIERLLWLICCFLAISGTIAFMLPSIKKYNSSPLVSSVAPSPKPIWAIDFPAVTLCNVNKAMQSKVEYMNSQSPWNKYKIETLYKAIKLVGYFGRAMNSFTLFEDDNELQHMFDSHAGEIDDFMKSVMHPLNETVLECWWKGSQIDCEKLFRNKRTDDGYCISFNAAQLGDMFKPHGDAVRSIPNIYHLNSAGAHLGLTVLLDPKLEEYNTTIDTFYGFQVLLHHSLDYADVSHRGFIISPGQEVFVAVTPHPIEPAEQFARYPPYIRRCLHSTENNLTFFSYYTFMNCFVECRIRTYNRRCGCVPYNYYTTVVEDVAKPCKFHASRCILTNFETFNSMDQDEGVKGNGMMNCTCPDGCSYTFYTTDVSSAKFHPNKDLMPANTDGINMKNLIQLRVFYKDWYYPVSRRRLLYTWVDMLASLGGIMGLLMGFSLISVIELICYLTIRPWFIYKKKQGETGDLLRKDFQNSAIFRLAYPNKVSSN